jgi:hypothetical protein
VTKALSQAARLLDSPVFLVTFELCHEALQRILSAPCRLGAATQHEALEGGTEEDLAAELRADALDVRAPPADNSANSSRRAVHVELK